MDITREQGENQVTLRVRGRIDGYCAKRLQELLEETLTSVGAERLCVDLAESDFLSSTGANVLMQTSQQVKLLGGSFGVLNPSPAANQTLELMGFRGLLVADASPKSRHSTSIDRLLERIDTGSPPPPSRMLATPNARVEVFDLGASASLHATIHGDLSLFPQGGYTEANCQRIPFGANAFGLGVGALGADFGSCREGFGEFAAVGGFIAALPTDGRNVPDTLYAVRNGVPDLLTCYALQCEGEFSALARFDSEPEASVTLTQLAQTALEVTEGEVVGLVALAETQGVVGAALRRSPALGKPLPMSIPEARDWLTVTAEPIYKRHIALVVGVVTKKLSGSLAPLLRPLNSEGTLFGHLHTAVFSYHPIPRGALDLKPVLATLFSKHELMDVLHLLNDDRPIVGAGQSEFSRGACWMGAIKEGKRP